MPTKNIEFEECVELLKQADYGHLAMSTYGQPYIVPINYIYDDSEKLYFHCGKKGRKLDCLAFNPVVCFNVTGAVRKVSADKACAYGYRYWSVNVLGTAKFIEDKEKKKAVLEMFSRKFSDGEPAPIADQAVDSVAIIEVEFKEVFGKRNVEPGE